MRFVHALAAAALFLGAAAIVAADTIEFNGDSFTTTGNIDNLSGNYSGSITDYSGAMNDVALGAFSLFLDSGDVGAFLAFSSPSTTNSIERYADIGLDATSVGEIDIGSAGAFAFDIAASETSEPSAARMLNEPFGFDLIAPLSSYAGGSDEVSVTIFQLPVPAGVGFCGLLGLIIARRYIRF